MNRPRGMIIGSAALAVVVVIALVVMLANHKNSDNGTKAPTAGSSGVSSSRPSGDSTTPSGGSTAPSGGGTALAPESGVLFGSSAGTTGTTQADRIAAVASLQTSLGVSLDIVHIYRTLDQPINISSNLHFIAEHKTLLISWAGGDTVKMSSGQLDATIAKRAQEVAALKVPVFFEYRWEMDRPNLQGTVHSGADYIAAWDRVRSIFTAQHVTNAEFVWCPQAKGFASGVAPSYYPGDNEVDWVCADVYSPPSGSVKSFASLAQPFMTWAKGHPTKPIMFGEFGADETWGSAVRAQWLSDLTGLLKATSQIKALVYYDSNAGDARYSLQGDPKALAALAAVAKAAPAKYK